MPRRSESKTTGLWEREPGSGVWWIRYRSNGVLKREKVGRKSDALALYQKRKTELRAGMKLPENFRTATVRFGVIADEIRSFSKKHHRDQRNLESRLKQILPDFGQRPIDQIKPSDIDDWLARNIKARATANRYRSLFSLIFREAIRNGRATSNPARLVRMRAEANGRIRFLSDVEEKKLRAVIEKRYPHHLPELVIALGTGMRLSEQFGLTWSQLDLSREEIHLDQTKNGSSRTGDSVRLSKAKELSLLPRQSRCWIERLEHVELASNPRFEGCLL